MLLLSDKPARTSGDEGGSGNSSCSGCYATGLEQRLPVQGSKGEIERGLPAHSVEATINMDDLRCGLWEPIREQGHRCLGSWNGIIHIPMQWRSLIP